MAVAIYSEQSFSYLHWQHVVDWNAGLITIPLGTLSDTRSGFAFENIDGTYTVFLGDDIVMGLGGPVGGTVDEIYRLSSLDGPPTADTTIAYVIASISATVAAGAYRDGGSAFHEAVFAANDSVVLHSPPALGLLDESPLIETYGGSDFISGSIYADEIHSGSGDDNVNGDDGSDMIEAGSGHDTVLGGSGHDTIRAGSGNDTVNGEGGHDVLYGDDGADTIRGGDGRDTIRGGNGADDLFGGNGEDEIYGGAGNDEIEGGDQADLIFGGDGSDLLRGNGGGDIIEGGDGADTIRGGDGDDLLRGQDGNDILNGEQGDDYLYPGLGDDTVRGGAGEDTVFYQREFDDYLLEHVGDLVIVTDLVGNGGVDTLETIEHVIFLDSVGGLP